jgi:hypothetical protein
MLEHNFAFVAVVQRVVEVVYAFTQVSDLVSYSSLLIRRQTAGRRFLLVGFQSDVVPVVVQLVGPELN